MSRMLIADDYPVVRGLLISIFQLDNYKLFLASYELQACELIQSTPVDPAILSLNMPEASGCDVLGWIRGAPAHKDLPVVLLAAKGHRKDKTIAMEHQVSLFLTKPCGSRDLRAQFSGLPGG